jgi:hypothetical protein
MALNPDDPRDTFDKLIPVLLLAIRRNYPEIAQGDIEEWMDLTTFTQAVQAMQGASGMSPVTEGE